MELNGLANLDVILKTAEFDGIQIDPELKVKLQEQIDLSIIYFRAWNEDNSIKWHDVRKDPERYKHGK